jgi:hypothetical protein
MMNNYLSHLTLPDLTVLLMEISISIYTHISSIRILPMGSRTKIVCRKSSPQ